MANRRQRRTKRIPFLLASHVFLGGLFTEVERAVPSPPEKQNDFAVPLPANVSAVPFARISDQAKSF